ncbi:hypothetical protein N7530_008262 [Penicillium desertorum]|uniref:Uncharacterized protein n=1 Tax=Penicillium desertorum TaxID=1303715 RepID=A0A9W9WNT9_9EURO|nr:hypothetical protein N7530_008262 [Penicillium desertorum]
MSFTPINDIPQLKGKVVLATGANSSLSKAAVMKIRRNQQGQLARSSSLEAAVSTKPKPLLRKPNSSSSLMHLFRC